MPSTAFRRVVHLTVCIALLAATLAAQSALSTALSDLSRYFVAATRLIGSAILGLDEVKPATVPSEDRAAAVTELRDISSRIRALTEGQAVLIADMGEYAKRVRARGFVSAGDAQEWGRILGSIRRISAVVDSVLRLVESSRWLKVALRDDDRATLNEVLRARVTLLSRLQDLPVPGSGSMEELSQLEEMNARYLELHKSLRTLNEALTRAADRLAAK